jgi:hypothetical protein
MELLALLDGRIEALVRIERLIKDIACVVIGVAWVIFCTSTAAGYRASAAACATGACSQTAGSDYLFEAAVFDVVALGGVAVILVGLYLSLSGALGGREEAPRDPPSELSRPLSTATKKFV